MVLFRTENVEWIVDGDGGAGKAGGAGGGVVVVGGCYAGLSVG